MSRHLHIVCLDALGPPDYGGAIDMYYKIKALAAIGVKITLHYFDYNLTRNTAGLENECVAVHRYKRKSFLQALPLSCPFIVQSRINAELIKRLNKDEHPVLLEGLHCAGIIPFLNKQQRVVLRMHNDEAAYYRHLAKTENSFLKKLYFVWESRLLQRYQHRLSKSLKLACLSQTDADVFQKIYGFQQVYFIPCFIPWQQVFIKEGKGDYCLYHGNMLVSENEQAALWLMKEVFSKTTIRLVIAGKGISQQVSRAAEAYPHVSLINNPTIPELDGLVKNAQINVLPSLNATGVKLKLLNALLNGRHCITNPAGVMGSKIENGVVVKEALADWIQHIELLIQQEFSTQDEESRHEVLRLYNNETNAKALNELY